MLAPSQSTRVGNYQVEEKIGAGSFASVYRARLAHAPASASQPEVVAIKVIAKQRLNKKLQAALESEIEIMESLRHENVLRMYEYFKSRSHIYLLLEYLPGGDLHAFVRKKGRLDGLTAQHFLRELAKGLECLWLRGLAHRDVKPHNLLLSSFSTRATLKLADFGFARHLSEAAMADTLCGSPLYMAPEILRHRKYDAKADLWSVGAVLFEMLAGHPPFYGANPTELLANIDRSEMRVPSSADASPDALDLLKQLLRRNPVERMTFEEFFRARFLTVTPRGGDGGSAAFRSAGPTSNLLAAPASSKNALELARAAAGLAQVVEEEEGEEEEESAWSGNVLARTPPLEQLIASSSHSMGTGPSRASRTDTSKGSNSGSSGVGGTSGSGGSSSGEQLQFHLDDGQTPRSQRPRGGAEALAAASQRSATTSSAGKSSARSSAASAVSPAGEQHPSSTAAPSEWELIEKDEYHSSARVPDNKARPIASSSPPLRRPMLVAAPPPAAAPRRSEKERGPDVAEAASRAYTYAIHVGIRAAHLARLAEIVSSVYFDSTRSAHEEEANDVASAPSAERGSAPALVASEAATAAGIVLLASNVLVTALHAAQDAVKAAESGSSRRGERHPGLERLGAKARAFANELQVFLAGARDVSERLVGSARTQAGAVDARRVVYHVALEMGRRGAGLEVLERSNVTKTSGSSLSNCPRDDLAAQQHEATRNTVDESYAFGLMLIEILVAEQQQHEPSETSAKERVALEVTLRDFQARILARAQYVGSSTTARLNQVYKPAQQAT